MFIINPSMDIFQASLHFHLPLSTTPILNFQHPVEEYRLAFLQVVQYLV
jgi:hypothetical protein